MKTSVALVASASVSVWSAAVVVVALMFTLLLGKSLDAAMQ